MPEGLNVIIIDDDPAVCDVVLKVIKRFYTWGEVVAFTDMENAKAYCKDQESGVAIFVLDAFMGDGTGFSFLDEIAERFPLAYDDTIIITGKASDELVDICLASDITYLLEKPIKPYALQMAVRAIVAKYLRFAKKVLMDPALAENISRF